MQSPLYKWRNKGDIKWMGAWKAGKGEGAWNHGSHGSRLDSKRQQPMRKGVESFLHQKEPCKRNSLASQEKSISELYRTNPLVRVSPMKTKHQDLKS